LSCTVGIDNRGSRVLLRGPNLGAVIAAMVLHPISPAYAVIDDSTHRRDEPVDALEAL